MLVGLFIALVSLFIVLVGLTESGTFVGVSRPLPKFSVHRCPRTTPTVSRSLYSVCHMRRRIHVHLSIDAHGRLPLGALPVGRRTRGRLCVHQHGPSMLVGLFIAYVICGGGYMYTCASTSTAHPQPLGHLTRAPPPPGASSSCGEVRAKSASARSRNFSKSSAESRRLAVPCARTCLQPGTGQR